ncbi:S1C family serine protease [Fulvivirgaceae bacterium PWU5]|uniref:S1C family serine protease n=1 Tax=Dawidia cretensis TaxID=2782350 RepID=A0AAP2GPW1_9BACT|nr:serine protease [Dawidia cretensis]MBT1709031.1 S1C family serine protease [Dawidia cretensis]
MARRSPEGISVVDIEIEVKKMKVYRRITLLIFVMVLVIPAYRIVRAQGTVETAGGLVIDDEFVYGSLERGARRLVDEGKTTAFVTLAEELNRTRCTVALPKSRAKAMPDTHIYAQCRKGVLVVGTLYKCSHCPNDHLRAASGFVIAEEGVAVTSYHIFRGDATDEKTDVTVVVMDTDGTVYAVTEVLAASLADDIAVFKIDTQGKKLPVLPLGSDAAPGDDANVIGHPHNMFYSFTQGTVSRWYRRNGGDKMSVTADFSQGSSGGPVLDDKGNVIGIVSATRSLYNGDNNVQMVSRETIPVRALRALTTK